MGAFGKVYLAKHRASSAACAIKSLSKGQLLEARLHQHVLQERDAMRDVAESPHTVRLLGTFQDATKLYMCTEVVMGGELFNRLNRVGARSASGTPRSTPPASRSVWSTCSGSTTCTET